LHPAGAEGDVPEHIGQNIDSNLAFYRRKEEKIGPPQRLLETAGAFMGRPSYLASLLLLVALWLFVNLVGRCRRTASRRTAPKEAAGEAMQVFDFWCRQ